MIQLDLDLIYDIYIIINEHQQKQIHHLSLMSLSQFDI